MKCPLSPRQTYPELLDTPLRWSDCLKEECACFIGDEDICVIVAIFGVLTHTEQTLKTIAKELTLLRPK